MNLIADVRRGALVVMGRKMIANRGAGEVAPGPVGDPSTMRSAGMLGAVIMMVLGGWLFVRGVTQSKRLNLMTFGGFFLFGAGAGRFADLTNPARAAKVFQAMADAMAAQSKGA